MEPHLWDVVVVGGGPAGLSAALLLGRARRSVVVLDSGRPRNRFAAHMHGVLGQEGAPPTDLLARGRADAATYGVVLRDGTAEWTEETDDGVTVVLRGGETLRARALVAATGITDELPEIPGLAERWGTSVLHCPYCHGWEFRDRRLGVLTTSAANLHQAELVRQWSEHVVVFTAAAGEVPPAQVARLRARGVRLVASPVVEVLGDGGALTGVRTADGELVALDALYTAGTPRPHDGFLAGLELARTEIPMGTVLAVDPVGRTSHPRVWAVGNVVNPAGTVPMSVGAGAMTGGAVNWALISEEFDAAVASA